MSTTREISAGTSIGNACQECVNVAKSKGVAVSFNFNGIDLKATPETKPDALVAEYHVELERQAEAYRNSPEGKAQADKRNAEIVRNQDAVTAAIRGLPGLMALKPSDIVAGKTRLDYIMGWLNSFVEFADDVAIDWNKAAGVVVVGGKEWVSLVLISGGFKDNDLVGEPPESFNTRERLGRYIIGQAINCLRSGMPPHPVAQRFIKEYFSLPA